MKCRVLIGTLIATVVPVTSAAQQQCLKNAWDAYNKADYVGAIKAADQCIDDFGPRAAKDQAALQTKAEKMPPTGAVSNASDRKQISERWAVNDVATAYFVKGRSSEHLFQKQKSEALRNVAQQAYKSAMALTYGRCWDPQGWFWSPAEAASERLSSLK